MRQGDKAFVFPHQSDIDCKLFYRSICVRMFPGPRKVHKEGFWSEPLAANISSNWRIWTREEVSGWNTTVFITVHPFRGSDPFASVINSWHLETVPPGPWSVLFSGKLSKEELVRTTSVTCCSGSQSWPYLTGAPHPHQHRCWSRRLAWRSGLNEDYWRGWPPRWHAPLRQWPIKAGHEKTRKCLKWVTWNSDLSFPAPSV